MQRVQDKDTRYFLEIDRDTLKVIGCDYEQKQYLDKGRQPRADRHRLFVTRGQYFKFIERCMPEST